MVIRIVSFYMTLGDFEGQSPMQTFSNKTFVTTILCSSRWDFALHSA